MEHHFKTGDAVITTAEEIRDYSNCVNDGIYTIPECSTGTIIGRAMYLQGAWRYPVRFDSVDNYHQLYYDGLPIGDGHYINEAKLQEIDKPFELSSSIDELLECI